jgi:hypothetical protein
VQAEALGDVMIDEVEDGAHDGLFCFGGGRCSVLGG